MLSVIGIFFILIYLFYRKSHENATEGTKPYRFSFRLLGVVSFFSKKEKQFYSGNADILFALGTQLPRQEKNAVDTSQEMSWNEKERM
jgi:hypothetical protein